MNIEKQTFSFLKQLKAHNDREWFQANRDAYEAALANVKSFIGALIHELSTFDPHINTDIQAGKCLFRIYRDTRFSKDKTPYKHWFAAGISVDGRKLDGPEYYLHIEPGKNFLAAGYWRPAKQHLDSIRQEIDYNFNGLQQGLRQGGWEIGDLSTEDKLKRAPAGYSEDHPHIDLLKLKSFILYQSFDDEQLQGKQGLRLLSDTARRILPFKSFIHEALDQ
ncbi:DUF2461 domain-containing protein [Sphingobacterium griseoflavum]|uniref:TIGR02453 family protein n=1 Tax=Sphingobacterium griseoflavum TaxID=1474952 RepID=A0ABQ3HXJ5_9SPHI|nr:DUF2461 domain-containing protein [Sphingobacterium griseoflavum]GHE29528.1 TIGR02453 family protein [Sphingobacterium griseoflavum]